MGTAAGSRIFLQFGWRAAAAFALGLYGLQIVLLLMRGPHCKRYTWFGYEGGFEARKPKPLPPTTVAPPDAKMALNAAADEKIVMGPSSAEELKVLDASGTASVVSESQMAGEKV